MSSDPLPAGLAARLPLAERRMLRAAVLEHIRGDRRIVRPALLHVGTPAGFNLSMPITEAPTDFGTRVDLIHVLAQRAEIEGVSTPTGVPWVWITRSGPAVIGDIELAWLGPVMHAFAEVEQPLMYFVVTRRGWFDPRSGLQRTWTRLRSA